MACVGAIGMFGRANTHKSKQMRLEADLSVAEHKNSGFVIFFLNLLIFGHYCGII